MLAEIKYRKSQYLTQQFLLTPQAAFKLGHQVFGEAQVLQSALEGLGGVLRLAAIALQALVSLEAAALSGFGVFFRRSFAWGHGLLLCSVRVYAE
jgi:hypothetical protein